MNFKKLSDQRGFTLVELMVGLMASAVIAYSIFVAMRLGTEQINTAGVKMTIQDSAREGLYRMIQELRQSAPSRITVGSGGNSITFNVPDPSSSFTGGYAVNWPGHQIQYAIGGSNNNQIIRTNLTTNETKVIANDVTALSFTGNSGQPTVVTVAMSVQRTLTNNRVVPATALQLTGQAKIRNV